MGRLKDSSLIDRFHDRYIPEPMSGCWLWTASATNQTKLSGRVMSYGYIVFKQEHIYAHRLSHIIHKGELIPGNHVHHKCENTLCVNPDHLQELSPAEHVLVTVGCSGYLTANATRCPKGHLLEKIPHRKNRQRVCLVCDRERSRIYKNTKRFDRFTQERTQRSGNAEKTHCPKGHEYTIHNTRWFHGKSGSCRTCIQCKLDFDEKNRSKPRSLCARPIPPGKTCKLGHELNEFTAYAFGNNSLGCWTCKDLKWEKRAADVRRKNQ